MIPRSYAEWLPLLDRFGEGDDTVLPPMSHGTLEWTNVVAERWTRHVVAALNCRLRALSSQLQVGLDRARGDYFAVSRTLLMARRGLSPLRAFASLPALPDAVRTHLAGEIDRWVSGTQQSLERHASTVRHDQGRLLKTIRDHPLTAADEAPESQSTDRPDNFDNPPFRGRRVVL